MDFDTGFDGTFELPLEGAALRYPPITQRGRASPTLGVARRDAISSQFDGDLRLEPVTWTNPPVRAGTGLVGVQALSTWKVALDQRAKKIYFLGEDLHRRWADQIGRSLAAGYTHEFNGSVLRLLRVNPGSPAAAAGLRAGDEILTINEAGAVEFSLDSAHAMVLERLLRVRRDGNEFDATMILSPPRPAATSATVRN